MALVLYLLSVIALVILIILLRWRPSQCEHRAGSPVRVQVVVLGDVGRSPRMQYHALSIANLGGIVDLIGYAESPLLEEVANHPRIILHAVPPPPPSLQTHNRLLFLVFGPLKVLLQALSLYLILVYRTPPAKWLLLQNPPSLPTIPIALLATFLRRTHLIIDWHNLGFSILALRLSPKHPLVRLAAFLEASLGRHASASFAVTHALAAYLRQPPFSLTHPVLTVHDRPAPHFQPLADPAERAIILRSCSVTAPFADELLAGSRRLLLSSTSWTADEDFGPLLRALECYAVRGTVKLLVVITGKGPLRAAFLQALGAAGDTLAPELVAVRTTFLPSAHAYAQLLAAADLGLCLHTSSSGLDLPMKVVDMFGAGLPVLAYDGYASFSELVQEGVNGMGFRDGDGLGRLMIELLGNEIQARRSLDLLKRGALRECGRRWDDEWIPTVGRLLQLQA